VLDIFQGVLSLLFTLGFSQTPFFLGVKEINWGVPPLGGIGGFSKKKGSFSAPLSLGFLSEILFCKEAL